METCVVLSARRYDFKDDKSGKQVSGMRLTYLTGDVEDTENAKGCAPITIAAPLDVFPQLGAVPGIYDMAFKQRPGPDGKPTLQCTGVKFKHALDGLLGEVGSAA